MPEFTRAQRRLLCDLARRPLSASDVHTLCGKFWLKTALALEDAGLLDYSDTSDAFTLTAEGRRLVDRWQAADTALSVQTR